MGARASRSIFVLWGLALALLACSEREAASPGHPAATRTADPSTASALGSVEVSGDALAEPRRPVLGPLAAEQRQLLWSSPEDPPAALLGGATEELVGKQYLTGNEHHLHLFAAELTQLRERGAGGAYLGVGADQAYLLMAWLEPEIAWLIDYDPDVAAIHRVHLSFLREAASPEAFIELWSRAGRQRARERLEGDTHPSMGEEDQRRRLVELQARHRRAIHRRLVELREAAASSGVANYLSDAERYAVVRQLALADRVRPLVADLRGGVGLAGIAAVARELGVELRVLYLSNAEEYWEDYGSAYRRNIAALPWADDAVVLRTLLTWGRNRDYAYNHQRVANYRAWLERPWVEFVYQVVHRPEKPVLAPGELDFFETRRHPSESPADRRWRRRHGGETGPTGDAASTSPRETTPR